MIGNALLDSSFDEAAFRNRLLCREECVKGEVDDAPFLWPLCPLSFKSAHDLVAA